MIVNGFGRGIRESRYFWGRGRRECTCRNGCDCNKCSSCLAKCICQGQDDDVCSQICGGGGGGHYRGYDPEAYQGLGGIVDSIGEGAKSIAGCPVPFVIGIAVGYLIKKSGMLKKVTL